MIYAKFVDSSLRSSWDKSFSYQNFNSPIEVEVDPPEQGQCGRGIHAIPLSPHADFTSCTFSGTIIALEINEEDIVWQDGDKKLRARKAIPLEIINRGSHFFKSILQSPAWSYQYAVHVDHGFSIDTFKATFDDPKWLIKYLHYFRQINPYLEFETLYNPIPDELTDKLTDEIRKAVSKDPQFAYAYAKDYDRKPHPVTKNGVLGDTRFASLYAMNVQGFLCEEIKNVLEQNPNDLYTTLTHLDHPKISEYREVFLNSSKTAYNYTKRYELDNIQDDMIKAMNENPLYLWDFSSIYSKQLYQQNKYDITRKIMCSDPESAYYLALERDRSPSSITREGASKNPEYAYRYALFVDKKATSTTRQGTYSNPFYSFLYALKVDKRSINQTRIAACENPRFAFLYAFLIDKKAGKTTRDAACKDARFAYLYAVHVDQRPHDATIEAVRQDADYAYLYALQFMNKRYRNMNILYYFLSTLRTSKKTFDYISILTNINENTVQIAHDLHDPYNDNHYLYF